MRATVLPFSIVRAEALRLRTYPRWKQMEPALASGQLARVRVAKGMLEICAKDAQPLGLGRRGGEESAKSFRRTALRNAAVLAAFGALLAGCASRPVTNVSLGAGASAPSAIPRERLIGKWGIASFHVEKDRKRTEGQARAQCSLPYSITRGPTDGVMMHAADDPKLYELKLKGSPDGKSYLGFEAAAGDPQDREILTATDSMLTMRFVDPEVHRRYGTFVYVRCG